MEKKKLNEDWYVLITMAVFWTISYLAQDIRINFYDSIRNFWKGKKKKESDEYASIIAADLGDNTTFLKGFAKIIVEEGGLKAFLQKMKTPQISIDTFDWQDFDDDGFVENMGRNTTDIVKKMLQLPVVKKAINDSLFEDKKILTKSLGNQFYIFLAQKNTKDAIKMTLNGVGEKLEDLGITESKKISLKKLLPKK